MQNPLQLNELMELVMPVTESGCWLWLGATQNDYGHILVDGEDICADKLSWETQRGRLPDNQSLLHICKVKCCVNPDHLVPMASTN